MENEFGEYISWCVSLFSLVTGPHRKCSVGGVCGSKHLQAPGWEAPALFFSQNLRDAAFLPRAQAGSTCGWQYLRSPGLRAVPLELAK